MKRLLMTLALLVCGAGVAHAQLTRAIDKAKNARAAENSHIAREQAPTAQQKPAPVKPATPSAPKTGATTPGATNQQKPGAAQKPAADTLPEFVMREVFSYDRMGARDPFLSLMNTSELRPVISDLRLLGILYDVNGRGSVAVMRDKNDQLYRAKVGQTLGRMRVAQIKPRAVIFSIEEFGTNRQDSLVLADTTKGGNP